jgi:hypothetical protein
MAKSDDDRENDPEFEKFADEFERHRDALYEWLADFMEEEDLGDAYMAQLLLDLSLRMRMTGYALGVENPSAAGLKLELDRMRRDVDQGLREAKKDAEEYIALVKKARIEAEEAEASEARSAAGEEDEEDDDQK